MPGGWEVTVACSDRVGRPSTLHAISPSPLVHVPVWASDWAAEEVFGIRPEQLNDDPVGRALDAIAPELDRSVDGGETA